MAFEAAGRTLNFTQAAQELHVSQAAISKQIKYLEGYFGFALFERQGRKVSLSSRGLQFHNKINASFNFMADAVEEYLEDEDNSSVTVSANSAMSHYWLGNAINEFYRTHKKTPNIRVITSDITRDLFVDEVDIAIAYEPGQRIGWKTSFLFKEEMFPIASPDYLKTHPFLGNNPENLFKHELLDFERIEPNWMNWKAWFSELDINTDKLMINHRFNNYIVLIDSAKRGLGITLGTRYLIDSKLKEKQLIRLSDFSVLSGRSYWLALNESKPMNDNTRRFYDWLNHYQAMRE
ncbi:LysR substrate-binding domain-containing protein [Marinomonas colpomeniae]|nr:LysR substrate-binding domain-containing protein [Marinomonas colpomeniae]